MHCGDGREQPTVRPAGAAEVLIPNASLPAGLRSPSRLRSKDEVPELPGIGPVDR